MSCWKLLQLVIGVTLGLLFVVGCGAPAATPEPPTPLPMPTAIPELPTTTPTPVPPMATFTPIPPTATPVPQLPTPTQTPTPAPAVGSVEGTLPLHRNLSVMLCDSYGLANLECNGTFKQTVLIDGTGYFLFPSVPPGEYYIFIDIPEALKDAVPPHCRSGEYMHWGHITDEIRVLCLSGEDLGPTVTVEAGQTTVYTPGQ